MNNDFNLLLQDFLEGRSNSIQFIALDGSKIGIFQRIYPNKKRDTTVYINGNFAYNFIADGIFKPNSKKVGTGGKRAYLKLYLDNVNKLSNELSWDAKALLVTMFDKVQWHSQRLKYYKKKSYLSLDEIVEMCGKRKSVIINALKELRENKLLWHDGTSYIISPNLVRKGGISHDKQD